jgi:hypothetical protein
MGRPKKTAKKSDQKEKKAPKERKDPRIKETYEEEVSFMCPVRGLVKQKVKVRKFKPLNQQDLRYRIAPTDELETKLDNEDDGMAIYSDGEELGITDAGDKGE